MANEAQRRKEFLERERKKEEGKKNPIKRALNSIFRTSRNITYSISFNLYLILLFLIKKNYFKIYKNYFLTYFKPSPLLNPQIQNCFIIMKKF